MHMATITSALVYCLAAAGASAGVTVDLGGLKSTTPASWKEVTVGSPMRLKQFSLPGKDGDAELVVFFFGQGQGGSSGRTGRCQVPELRSCRVHGETGC